PGHGETAEHRKQWLPLTVLLLWITGTAAHLYSVGYVDDQKFELAKFSVLAWAIGWLLCAKITLLLSRFTPAAPEIMLSLPIAAPLLAWERPGIAVTLHILNAAIFGVLCIRWKGLRIPAILGGVSLLLALFTVPNDWLTPVIKGYNKAGLAFSLVAALLMIKAIRTRTAKWALIGSFVTVIFLLGLALNSRFSPHYALQFAPLFALVHSLFWKGPQERGSTVLLLGAATILCLDSYAIAQQGHYAPHLLPYLCAAPLLVITSFRRAVVPIIAAIASMLVPPLSYATSVAEGTPTGILALMASFILFAVGTTFAVWKNRFSNNPKGTKEMSI
ncbi:MAG TPA: hypothetical protein VM735_13670, partial [Candidatus Kapabacteria bacterium]|nr:hypothetical protein [Candidatus Kapabacteria bacterium]